MIHILRIVNQEKPYVMGENGNEIAFILKQKIKTFTNRKSNEDTCVNETN